VHCENVYHCCSGFTLILFTGTGFKIAEQLKEGSKQTELFPQGDRQYCT